MLKDNFFNILGKSKEESGELVYRVKINAGHDIFKGHFPGQPISPGVCNVQMVKECAEDALGSKLMISNLKQCKFTQLLIPTVNSEVDVRLQISEGEVVTIKGQISEGESKFMDMKAEAVKE